MIGRRRRRSKQAQQEMNQPLDVVTDFLMPGFANPMLMAGPGQLQMNFRQYVGNVGQGMGGMMPGSGYMG